MAGTSVVEGRAVKRNESMLYRAIATSDVTSVCNMLEKGLNQVDEVDENLDTPLHFAASLECCEMVEILLEKGGNVKALNLYEETPLHKAASGTESDIVEKLLEKKACVNIKNKQGYSPFHIAVSKGYKKIVGPMLDRGADVHAVTADKETALHIAASHWNCILAETLVDRGADVNARDRSGRTPLHIAVNQADLMLVELLLEKGADINVADDNRQTPLHLAADLSNCRAVRALVDRRALLNCQDKHGHTALHLAVRNVDVMMAEILLTRGALPDVRDKYCLTPFDLAARQSYSKLVLRLLALGVAVDPGLLWFCHTNHHHTVVTHLVKLKAAGLCREFVVPCEFSRLNEQCHEEFQTMRKKLFKSVLVSDVFDRYYSFRSISQYKQFMEVIESPEVQNEFPLYSFVLIVTLSKAFKRQEFLHRALNFFTLSETKAEQILQKQKHPFYTLPSLVIGKILLYLSDVDLQNLIALNETLIQNRIT